MPTISSNDLALLRGENHRSQFYLTPCPATALWSARINGTLDRGETAVTFDGGSGANFAAIGAYQELWIGSTAGAYDVGRIRIKSITSGDSGVSGTVTVAANSIVTSDNDYLTFVGWYLLKPVRPLIGDDGTFYKDTTITYSNQNSQPNPICIAGENRAGFIDASAGYFEITSQLADSYAIANGATISSYSASLVYGAGTPTISINSSTGVGTIRFPTAGVYWIKWTVTDSNGKTQDTYRWYYAHSPTINNTNYPITDFSINNLSGDVENGGWSCGIQLHDNATLDDIPDYAPCILWADNWYDTTKKNITYLPDESSTIINGYVRREQFNSDLEMGSHTGTFELTTIQGVNENKYNFSVSLEAAQTVDTWWKYPSWLTPTRAVHHFYKWHSTLLEVADLIGLDGNTDGIAYAEFQDGTLYGMANTFLRDRSIRCSLVCDAGGRMHVLEDIQLRPDSERTALDEVQEITSADKSGEIVFIREPENRTPFVHTSGFSFSGTFDSDGKPEATAICAIAPGDNPLEDGQSPISYGKQTFTSQSNANLIAGRILATENNKLPEIRINLSGNYLGTLGIHLAEFWSLSIASGDTIRGIAETHNLILQNVVATLNVSLGTVITTVTFEAEATGQTGTATSCPEFPDLPGDDFTLPELEDLSGALVTAASVNYLPPQTKSWTVRTAEATEHLYADPFWTTTQDSFASKDAIIWRCGVGYIKRSVDGGENWTSVTPSIDPPNDSSDSPAPAVANVTFAQGEASFITDETHVFLARWQNGDDEWRTWIIVTEDNGDSWSWLTVGGGTSTATIETSVADDSKNHPDSPAFLDMGNNRVIVLFIVDNVSIDFKFVLIDTVAGEILDQAGSGGALGTDGAAMCKLTDTTLAVIHKVFDVYYLAVTVYDITGDTVTNVVEETIHNYGNTKSGSPPLDALSIARVSDTEFIACYNLDETGAENGCAIYGEFDSGAETITFGPEKIFNSGTTPFIVALEGELGTHVYFQDDTLTDLKARMLTVSSGVISLSSKQEVVNGSVQFIGACIVDGDKAVVAYSEIGESDYCYARVITLSNGSSAILGTDYQVKAAAVTAVYCASTGTDQGVIAYRHGTNAMSYKPFVTSGHELSLGDEVAYPINGGYPVAGYIPAGLVLAGYDADDSDAMKVFAPGSGAMKGLGLAIGKALGETAYITGWANSGDLVVSVVDLTVPEVIGSFGLGAATEDDVDDRLSVAYPHTPFALGDEFVYIYGRFSINGVNKAHILYSEDYGQTFAVIEESWGTDHCGSLVEDFGTIYAVRNTSAQPKLYVGDLASGLTVRSTTLSSGHVNPFGMIYDWLTGTIYIGMGVTGAVMVIRANDPFTTWIDITYDHGTGTGIKAIVAL